MRIAMWSGPRNLSTAMMYSFGARSDFEVMDEPFYAAYLAGTGVDHPMRADILATHETDANRVVQSFVQTQGHPHLYMKHMPHHMLEAFPLDWAKACVNVHLIRHPARVIASYAAKRANPSLEEIGFHQQVNLYKQLGGVVVDSFDVRFDPESTLRRLCAAIGLPFDPAMLSWQPGPRPEDGVWAQHWYGTVHQSTGFASAEGPLPALEPHLQLLCDQVLDAYSYLADRKI
ncbi:MAG: HAD family hydrolase [Pseudomonadota bacterium]